MKRSLISTISLAAVLAASSFTIASAQGGAVCGRVDAGTPAVVSLVTDPLQYGTVIARSATEEVQTTVGNGGTYCFKNLHADLHTIVAIGESANYSATVTPVDGKTLLLDLTTKN